MPRLTLPASALALLCAVTPGGLASASAGEVSNLDAFRLWAACVPIALEVGVSEQGRTIGLREADIETAVRSRLRAARIYEDKHVSPALMVVVQVFRGTFTVDVMLLKAVEDRSVWSSTPKGVDRLFGFAATWMDSTLGTHGGSPDYVLSAVTRLTDTFIDKYLRVNEEACR